MALDSRWELFRSDDPSLNLGEISTVKRREYFSKIVSYGEFLRKTIIMSSDVDITTSDANKTSVAKLEEFPAKHLSQSLQNIQNECLESKPPKGPDTKQASHRRSLSHSLSPSSQPTFFRSNSYQPPSVAHPRTNGTNHESYQHDIIKDIECDFGGIGAKQLTTTRLVIVSSKVRNISSIRHALLPNVSLLQYNCDTSTLNDLEAQISQTCSGQKLQGVAFILSCSGTSLQLLSKEEKVIGKDGNFDKSVQEFFTHLVQNHFVATDTTSRIDFLGWYCLQNTDSLPPLVKELQNLTGVNVGAWRSLSGHHTHQRKVEELGSKTCIGELYFRLEKLRNWSGHHQQSLAGFEKIRTVGKGAYGAAVLYKKKDDESLVILKEINMHDLNASERQLALNEVSVLAMLDHPNIISYYDSFEEDGVLMIEMEYADNGTLAQFLAKQDHSLEEKDVLNIFQQIVAAIRHIHSHNILHRDLKTDNIFLTKEGVVKIGDFGISKMMGSANKGAQTVLGTPYYISPEMCEGKQYSFKSDIWALGCILYEIICLQKTFEGSNLPAVVNKIMKGHFAPVKGNYSEGLKALVTDMLKKDPEERPEANSIMYQCLPALMSSLDSTKSDQDDDMSTDNISKKAKIRSVLYYLESSTTVLTCINDLPPRMKIKHMAVGPDHVIVTTIERQVFAWGYGGSGQLGHGDTRDRYTPILVEALKGKSITTVSCGVGFSVFRSDNGLILTCGDGSNGCLGHGDWCSTSRPRLVESLLSVDVMAVASGLSHVVVIGRDGEVLSWGMGSSGQLGLGTEENRCVPTVVSIAESVVFTDVQCGIDGTMLISDVGGVFACGNNENNKLGLNNRQGFLMAMKNIFTKTEVEGKNVPTPVRALARHRVLSVSMGVYHTAVIVEPGHVITFGKNSEGQLGTQNTKPSSAPVEVKTLQEKTVTHVQSGEHYTVASTKDHELYYWGLRYTVPLVARSEDTTSQSSCNDSSSCIHHSAFQDDQHVESVSSSLGNSTGSTKMDREIHDHRQLNGTDLKDTGDSNQSQRCYDVDSLGFRPLSSVPRRSLSASSQENFKEKDKDKDKTTIRDDSVIIFEPMEIIKLKQGNEKMLLGNVYCHGENLFIQVETTAPPPRRKTLKKRVIRRKSSQSLATAAGNSCSQMYSGGTGTDEISWSSETSEKDAHSAIPTWLMEELAQSGEIRNDGNEPDDTSGQSEEERRAGGIDSSMSSIQINRALTPVASSMSYSPHLDTQTFISGDKCSPRTQTFQSQSRTRTYSMASSESTPDSVQAEVFSDSSSTDVSKGSKDKSAIDASGLSYNKVSKQKLQFSKLAVKTKGPVRGRGRGQPFLPKEKPSGRGFVSDVTVKRREETLLFELEMMKQEKKQADARVRLLEKEREAQQALLKQEAEKLAKEREKNLISEVEKLRLEIATQNSLLQDRERMVGELKSQLQAVMEEPKDFSTGLTPRTPRNQMNEDSTSSNQPTPRAESVASGSSKRSNSKICVLQ